MRFAELDMSLLLLFLPLLAVFFWLGRRRTVMRLGRLADGELGEWLVRRVSDRKAILKSAMLFGSVFLLAAALTRPQMGGRSTLVKKEGIDLLFVLDVSKSMVVQDIRPSRLTRAKLELMYIMENLKGDRVGLISFAGAAFVQCPLTTDYAAARMFLKSLSPNDMPVHGTAIGRALLLGHKLLTTGESPSGSRLVVLLTDGEDHGEELDEALAALEKDSIPVFVVGIGSESGEPIPEYDDGGAMTGYHRDKGGQTVMSRLDSRVLRRIAGKTGGKYLNLQSGGTLDDLHGYVQRMQKQQFESALYTQYDEKFYWALWPAFVFLFLASLLDERRGSRWMGLRR